MTEEETRCRSRGTAWRPMPVRAEWFTGAVFIDSVAAPSGRFARQRDQRPFHARRAHGLAHAPERPDDLGHRGRRPLPAARRPGRGDPSRRPRLLRARRGALARRGGDPVHGTCRDRRSTRRAPGDAGATTSPTRSTPPLRPKIERAAVRRARRADRLRRRRRRVRPLRADDSAAERAQPGRVAPGANEPAGRAGNGDRSAWAERSC